MIIYITNMNISDYRVSVASSIKFNAGSRKQVTNIFPPKFTLDSNITAVHFSDSKDQDLGHIRSKNRILKSCNLNSF